MSQNTNASSKITNYRRYFVKSINFNTYSPNKTYTNQAIDSLFYSPVYDSFQEMLLIPSRQSFRVSGLQLTLDGNVSATSSDYWETSIYTYVWLNQDKEFIPTVLCPAFTSSGMQIDSCDTVYHDSTNIPYQIEPTGQGDVFNSTITYVEIKLKGHFTSNQSGNAFNLSGPILVIKNYSDSSSIVGFRFVFGFDSFKVYRYVPDDDKAAEEIADRNQKEYDSVDNIDNQSESDAQGSTNSQTTSLINTLSGFVSAFNNIKPSANCNMTLPFPDFFGGDTPVDICQGKDKAPALISIGSSILLITTFVPLAYILIKMIYNEIRSWTNG